MKETRQLNDAVRPPKVTIIGLVLPRKKNNEQIGILLKVKII